jgi:hypothetical protein
MLPYRCMISCRCVVDGRWMTEALLSFRDKTNNRSVILTQSYFLLENAPKDETNEK